MTIRRVALPAPGRGAGRRRGGAGRRRMWPRLPRPGRDLRGPGHRRPRITSPRTGSARCCWACPGGIDSALTATIAADAIGADRVHVVLMPSRYSSDHSVGDAEDLVKRQGVHARTVPIAAHGRRLRGRAGPARPGRGEPAGPGPRHDPHVAVQRARPPGADHREQERAGRRLLHPVRRLGGRLRADQGRAQDAGVGAGRVAQRAGRRAAARSRPSRRTRSPSRPARSWRRASWTATRCPTTRSSTGCWTTTSSGTWGPPS